MASPHPAWQKWYDGLSRNDKLRYRISMKGNRWDDWLCDLPKAFSDREWLWYYDGGWSRLVCVFLGHSPISDHCGISAHDYCSTCQKSMPDAAKNG